MINFTGFVILFDSPLYLQNPRKMLLWISRLCSLDASHHLHKFPIFPPISPVSFSTSTPKISLFDYLVNHHNFPPECAANISSSSSTKLLNNPKNADSILNFLRETGFSKNQIETVVRRAPVYLSAHLEKTIKPKFKLLQDLGFQYTDLANIISTCPWLLSSSADTIRLSILRLKNVLGPNADIFRLFKHFGKRLIYDFERTFMPNIEYLKSCGICSSRIATYVCRYPLICLSNQEKLKGIIQRADEMGVQRESKMFIRALSAMFSMSRENWELKLDVFRELGFSEQDILNAFRVAPHAFTASERKIKEATQLLLCIDHLGISEIVRNPVLLTYSVEKRLKPRVQVLKVLQSKNLLKKKLGFAAFFQMTDANFTNKYLIPYSDELGDLCA